MTPLGTSRETRFCRFSKVVRWGWNIFGWASPMSDTRDDLLFGCGAIDFAGTGVVRQKLWMLHVQVLEIAVKSCSSRAKRGETGLSCQAPLASNTRLGRRSPTETCTCQAPSSVDSFIGYRHVSPDRSSLAGQQSTLFPNQPSCPNVPTHTKCCSLYIYTRTHT